MWGLREKPASSTKIWLFGHFFQLILAEKPRQNRPVFLRIHKEAAGV
jgi:hypothetical protein